LPTYTFKNKDTGEVFEEFMGITKREQYLQDNPHLEQVPGGFVGIGDPVRMGMKKPDDSFRDILRNINKQHYKAKVNTF
jgi:hypothetical protein